MDDYLKEGFIDEVKGALKGEGESGQDNVIEKIKVNGVEQAVDPNKAVDIPVPTKTSELENDEGFLTEHQDLSDYAKKADVPTVPTNVSEFTNDSYYQTAEDVANTLEPYAKSSDVATQITEGIAKVVADAPESFDTLKEMSDWIAGHEDDASAMNSAIQDNKNGISELNTNLAAHTGDKNNPHAVTKDQVGLGNVDNTADLDKPVSKAQATAIADAKKAGTDAQNNLKSHIGNTNNPHSVTKSQVGLGNVGNFKAVSTVASQGLSDNEKSNARTNIGLGKVDNTADLDKPISTATQTALDEINSNLCANMLKPEAQSCNVNGIEITANNDGTYTLNGTANEDTSIDITTKANIKGDGNLKRNLIKISGDYSGTVQHASFNSSWGYGSVVNINTPSILNTNIEFVYFRIKVISGTSCDNLKVGYVVNDNPIEYVAYTGNTGSLNSDVANISNSVEKQNESLDDQKMLGWSVPEECPVKNYVDSNGVFHQRVGRVDLGSLDFSKENTTSGLNAYRVFISNTFIPTDKSNVPNIYVKGYTAKSNSSTWTDKIISYDINGKFVIVDNSYTNETTFKNAMKGVYLYYELATPITKTIDGNEATERINKSLSFVESETVGKNKFDQSIMNNATTDGIFYHIKLKPNTTYIMSTDCESNSALAFFLSGNVESGASSNVNGVRKSNPRTATTDNNGIATVAYRVVQGDYPTRYNWQIEEGTSATDFESYVGNLANEIVSIKKDLGNYATKANPTCTGSFSLNRKSGTTVGDYSTTEGKDCTASGAYSHAEGGNSIASYSFAHAEGNETTSTGQASHAEGIGTIALDNQHAQGHYNSAGEPNSITGTSTGTAFVIGNGTSGSKSNAFRVTGEGVIYSTNATVQAGADYAEYFEWSDENKNKEDRVGLFVTFDENAPEKIRIANSGDYILGIVSGMPSVIGNGDEDWKKRFILDEFGRYIVEEFEYEETVVDEETGEETTVTKIGTKWKENPDYDDSKPYAPRKERPEWSAIGMLGVLSVYDDGTCKVNGYCKCSDNGVATKAENKSDGYRVIARVTDNIIKIVFR